MHASKLTTSFVFVGGGSTCADFNECEDNMRNILSGCMDTRLVDVFATRSIAGEAPLAMLDDRPCLLRPG